MYHAVGIIIFLFILDVQGSLRNTQCKRTQDWNGFQFQCSKNHTIYIKHHIIEDGFQKLSNSDMFFGCQETDALYCGAKLPINQKLGQNNSAFSAAVSDCNGKIQCNVSAQYFKDTEADLRKLCSQSNPSELKKASFRQSIDYECIQDYQVIDMCTNRNDSRSPHVYLQLSGDWGSCSCDIIGDISRVNILQTDMAEVLIYNESRRLFQHQHSSVSLYGVEVQVITKKLLIHIQGRSAASRILIKVLGNMTIHCEELKSMSTLQDQDPTSTPLTSVETHQKGEQMLRHSSIGPNVTDVDRPSLPSTMETHTSQILLTGTDTVKSSMASQKATQTSTDNGNHPNLLNNKALFTSLFLFLTAVILLVIFFLLLSVIQRRKDRDLLLAILHKLEESNESIREEQHSKATETSHIQITESERNYQEIPLQFLNRPKSNRLSNPVYDTGSPIQENVCSKEKHVEFSMADSMDVRSDRFLLGSDNGIYELQKSF
ncbi:uncharacterized protein LOC133172129 [Saccostrea echinata]|uniref:uncharacterized protein LOC133172129 n=1 Tax=Saccostrea echinata TaxID=191078 RepID=UPI002A826698|nr:uncharacterized protein LOC133172129 [Saccostrea echinata]